MPGMALKKSVVRKAGARSRRLERVVKGFANHRRIEILELLGKRPEMSVGEISIALEIELKTASEHLLLAKTRALKAAELVSFIRKHHTYELPEITVMPITGGLGEYLDWIKRETTAPKQRGA